MKAIVQTRCGLRSLRIMDVPEPVPRENQVPGRTRSRDRTGVSIYRRAPGPCKHS